MGNHPYGCEFMIIAPIATFWTLITVFYIEKYNYYNKMPFYYIYTLILKGVKE